MDLGELASNVADCGLAQSIQAGLQKNLMVKPKFPNPEQLEAKKGSVTADCMKGTLGQFVVNQWAGATGSSADNFEEFKTSAQFGTLCKYLCLKETTEKAAVTTCAAPH